MENNSIEAQESTQGKVKAWFEDNLRVLLSIFIVIAIAGGIYSYSQRSQAPTISDTMEETQEMAADESSIDSMVSDENPETEATIEKKNPEVSSENISKETEDSFIESANRGDGMTHLARRALADYLEKNPDSSLTPEHKIYIEDYLRKNVPQKKLSVGSSAEFSKTLIQNSIEKSKTLNENQLNNLKKYSSRVPSLR